MQTLERPLDRQLGAALGDLLHGASTASSSIDAHHLHGMARFKFHALVWTLVVCHRPYLRQPLLRADKSDPDPVFFPPNNLARAVHLIRGHDQIEVGWNADRAFNGKSRASGGQVANYAVYCPTAERNGSSRRFRDAIRCSLINPGPMKRRRRRAAA